MSPAAVVAAGYTPYVEPEKVTTLREAYRLGELTLSLGELEIMSTLPSGHSATAAIVAAGYTRYVEPEKVTTH